MIEQSAAFEPKFSPPMAGKAPRVDSRQMSWWAEGADGTRDKELVLVLDEGGEYQLKEEQPGDNVVLRVYTPSLAPNRLKPVEITFQAPGCEKIRIDEQADALFWTESAVEKFLFPYYAAHRLFTDEEMQRLKDAFKSDKAVALWHRAPSTCAVQYGKTTDDVIAVLVRESEQGGEIRTEWRGIREFLNAPAMS